MDLSQRLSISYFKNVATINEDHKIYMVQHQETGKLYVKKILDVYSLDVYEFLKKNTLKGVPQIIDFYEIEGSLIVIEEYISGSTLKEIIDNNKLTCKQICSYMIELCEILERLHSHKPRLIHRDIKPSNIMITSNDHVVLLDFNAAKFSSGVWSNHKDQDTVLLGTQGYAAPEQYGFMESSPQTDIYPIGIILREAVALLHLTNPGFNRIIGKCTDMNPYKRYSSVKLLKLDLMKLGYVDFYSTKQFSDTSWLPPGFRTMTPWKMAIALPAYGLMIYSVVLLECEHEIFWGNIFDKTVVLIVMLEPIFILCDYRGICRIFPLCRSNNVLLRIIGMLMLIIIFIFITLNTFKLLHTLLMSFNII